MENEPDVIANMRAITVSREYGSGGGEIATRLANRLQWQLIDHEIVVKVAKELGISESEAEARDEQAESLLSRILNSMQGIDPALMVNAPSSAFTTDAESYRRALNNVVNAAVKQGHVVIVGRGGQIVLAKRRDVLHVRVVAPVDMRVSYVMSREGLNQEAARARIQMKDRDRVRYLQAEYQRSPTEADLYDLTVNTASLSLDQAVELIVQALHYKAERLSVTTGQLGPGVGLSRYPGKAEDIRPPADIRSPEK